MSQRDRPRQQSFHQTPAGGNPAKAVIGRPHQPLHHLHRWQHGVGHRAVRRWIHDQPDRAEGSSRLVGSLEPLAVLTNQIHRQEDEAAAAAEPSTATPSTGWTSTRVGTPIPHDRLEITAAELKEIYPQLERDSKTKPPRITEEEIADFASELSDAFRLMRIDTVEAQAAYLGHGAVEADQFRRFTETQGWRQWYASDPTTIRLDTGWLRQAGSGPKPKYPSYRMGGKINPYEDPTWQSSYIGRGPLQVTNIYNYRETLKQMERMAEEYGAAGQIEEAMRIHEAVLAIREDPRQAANPHFTFLFSAAYEKWMGGDVIVGDTERDRATFAGGGPESRWVTGGATEKKDNATRKREAWERAHDVLSRKANAGQKAISDQSTANGTSSTHELPEGLTAP